MENVNFAQYAEELPLQVKFSVAALADSIKAYLSDKDHPFYTAAQHIQGLLAEHQELIEGIDADADLAPYNEVLELLFGKLFPEQLQSNEIKSVVLPFVFRGFLPTKRFSTILKNAGPHFELRFDGFDSDRLYFFACGFILAKYYQQPMPGSLPMHVHIPDVNTGQMRYYRSMLNADFIEIYKTDEAPELTKEDIDELLRDGENIELWKEKFPPQSYIFKGFALMNLFDNTPDFLIHSIRDVFLRNDQDVFTEFRESLTKLYQMADMEVGYSVYNMETFRQIEGLFTRQSQSLIFPTGDYIDPKKVFCEGVISCVLKDVEIFAISDVEHYGEGTDQNGLYQRLAARGIKSFLFAPVRVNEDVILVLELGSPHKNKLNPLNAHLIKQVLPAVQVASQRAIEETGNRLESTIQEHYTSIHPSVKWRFEEAAQTYHNQLTEGVEDPVLDEIVFDDVVPLYGQSDIKGSSSARNAAIQADLELQLSLVVDTLEKVKKIRPLPIFEKLVFRVQQYIKRVQAGLKAGDEVGILEFLRREIYPVFNYLESQEGVLAEAVTHYMSFIDPQLQVVYRQRKSYDDSVNYLNKRLAGYLDKRQEEAQAMFPHYFERYKTDGVEYNIYIGDSLVKGQDFHEMYLQNLRLWQLQVMYELEQVAYNMTEDLPHPLRVASLILVHSNPLAIRFRMDEKQFDVDGAYNVRYEIVKKRIDKSLIKGTNERLTQPGKIAIVYSQDAEAEEYLRYIEFLQAEKYFGEVEMLDLEDLQGLSGLRAIRLEVLYEKDQRNPSLKSTKRGKVAS
ncbi:MAG: GAF domain-containing protein [Bacteroidota bacterium]